MTFTANDIGQCKPFPPIPMEEVILSYAKAMVIPYGLMATLVGCRTSLQSEIASLSLNPQGTFYHNITLMDSLKTYTQ